MNRWFLPLMILAVTAFAGLMPAKAAPAASAKTITTTKTASGADAPPRPLDTSAYVLRPGDELVLTFLGVADPPYDAKIREDGGLYVPRVGEVHAGGYTIAQLRPIIETRLAKHLLHSEVEIGIKSTAPQYAMVFGEVLKPGQVEVVDGMTIVQAVSEAGGYGPGADQADCTLVRHKQTLRVLLSGTTDPPPVMPNDVVYVPKAGRISVTGSVNLPGVVSLNGSTSTVWEAIMSVGGPKPEAAMERVLLARFGSAGPDGQSKVLDLSGGATCKDAQTTLYNGDAITVPEQHILLVSIGEGGGSKVLPLGGPTNVLDVLVEGGVGDKATLKSVALIRSKDLALGSSNVTADKVETVDVAKALRNGSTAELTKVNDGDVVIVNPPAGPRGIGSILQYTGILTTAVLLRNL